MAGVKERVFDLQKPDLAIYEKMESLVRERLREVYQVADKLTRRERIEETLQFALKEFGSEDEGFERTLKGCFRRGDRKLARRLILETQRRIDGRGYSDIRDISCEVGILPRTHGSALFTRGKPRSSLW